MTALEVSRQDRRRLTTGTARRRLVTVRTVALLASIAGVNYVVWRWAASVNWHSWWIAVPLILAETYSVIDSLLFAFGAWRLRERGEPPTKPSSDVTVDVFITTYNEPVEMVVRTARAAQAITHPHTTWILDDGNRPEMRAAADSLGIGVITRGADWIDRPRHAKAGNLNNALLATQGEFLLILDADQVPEPGILDRTLGYFKDPRMALVQTPQWFENVPEADLLGSQAPLFYGPIQQSKDGWNAAFFCGSNAILRREALMQLGISRYVVEVEASVQRTITTSRKLLARARETETAPGYSARWTRPKPSSTAPATRSGPVNRSATSPTRSSGGSTRSPSGSPPPTSNRCGTTCRNSPRCRPTRTPSPGSTTPRSTCSGGATHRRLQPSSRSRSSHGHSTSTATTRRSRSCRWRRSR